MSQPTIVIAAAKRTPIGAFQGQLSDLKTPELGAMAIKAALHSSGFQSHEIDEVVMGCVLTAGLGQAPARQAALGAGLSDNTPSTTVNKVCGSGMKAIMIACDQLRLGTSTAIIAGGMESMSNAPYLLDRARSGLRLGHGAVIDHMFYDGLEDPYNDHRLMGTFAEDTAEKYEFTRQAQDDFASLSLKKAHSAQEKKAFEAEIFSFEHVHKKGTTLLHQDEPPLKANLNKISTLKPAFRKDGTVTAANSSSIADGAAALLLLTEQAAQEKNISSLGIIRGYTTFAHAPQWFTTAPVGAIKKLCQSLKWSVDDVDLFEINEAFAVVTMATIKDLNLNPDRVNVNGGACALGHPIGASGARIVVTLVHALRHRGLKKGIACLCLGGGEATAIAVEIP